MSINFSDRYSYRKKKAKPPTPTSSNVELKSRLRTSSGNKLQFQGGFSFREAELQVLKHQLHEESISGIKDSGFSASEVYSLGEKLDQTEKDVYKAKEFDTFVPFAPPTRELCVF
ncbi:hypothetical protein Ciccas_000267 [Cichlidogyrus casuarinus]|uniref:Uncharacterized protein n=1 Tax=Cichlidogyrus casuarinus TaxID=1844966 RepID=A0ABD2QNP6_9PLAT